MRIHKILASMLGAVALAACGDKTVQDITKPATGGANVRFYNFGPNAPGVNFYANDLKVTAVVSATGSESTNGTAFGSVGNGGNYSLIPAGQYTFTGKIAATTDKDLSISPVSASVADGKWYSYYVSGIYDGTAKKADAFIIEDAIPAVDYNQAYVRFVNAISNSTPQTLYAKNTATNTETAIGSAVTYKSGGTFIAVTPGVYDLNTRAAGSSTNLITRAGVSFNPGHVYTISSRGDMTVTSTSAANRPQLDNTSNR